MIVIQTTWEHDLVQPVNVLSVHKASVVEGLYFEYFECALALGLAMRADCESGYLTC